MLSIIQLEKQIRSNIQLLVDSAKLNLHVGPITDRDWDALSTGYSVLNWPSLLHQYENNPNKFSITIKLKDENSDLPAGAFICLYDIELNVIEICCVENFVKDKKDHPLCGKMFFFTMSSVLMFASVSKTKKIILRDVCDEKLVKFYNNWGFGVMNRFPQIDMSANVDDIVKTLRNIKLKKGM